MNLQPVPVWALPFEGDPEVLATLNLRFSEVWLKWFIDWSQAITTGAGADGTIVIAQRTFAAADPAPSPLLNSASSVLESQIFGA